MKIYTRTGDKGTTGLFGGKRVAKDNIRIEAVGTVDELNSAIGLAIAEISNFKFQIPNVKKELIKIQGDLFEIGAVIATPARVRTKEKRIHKEFGLHLAKRVSEFETFIEKLTEKLPALRSFILPGGSRGGATLHLARSMSRRAERRVVALSHKEALDDEIIIYINRLSDLLFTMARFVNKQKRILEIPWKGVR